MAYYVYPTAVTQSYGYPLTYTMDKGLSIDPLFYSSLVHFQFRIKHRSLRLFC